MIIRYNQKQLSCIDIDIVSSIDENPIKSYKIVRFGVENSGFWAVKFTEYRKLDRNCKDY